ncbi:hypothetical protein, partial [Bradyrhizobium sp.]|uniref:hypothetical protein n=1 Tax=Bradyrhizobium sp. TaxID=376 RepID=UPI003C648211
MAPISPKNRRAMQAHLTSFIGRKPPGSMRALKPCRLVSALAFALTLAGGLAHAQSTPAPGQA